MLRATLSQLCQFPILIVDDLDAIDSATRETILYEVIGGLRDRFSAILCACWSVEPKPWPDDVKAELPWLARWSVIDGDVSLL